MKRSMRRRCPICALWLSILIMSFALSSFSGAASPASVDSSRAPGGHHEDDATPADAVTLLWWRADFQATHVAGDTIYGSLCTDGDACWLAAADRATGADMWIAPVEGEVVGIVDSVIVARSDDRIFALETATRQERWSTPVARIGSGIVLAGERLYVTLPGGIVAAIDPATGSELWRASVASMPPAGRLNGFSVAGDTLILTISEAAYERVPSSVLGLSGRDGSELWRITDSSGGFYRIVATEDDTVYVTAGAGRELQSISARDGSVNWTVKPEIGSGFYAAAVGSYVFATQSQGGVSDPAASIVAYDLTSGEEIWRFAVEGKMASTPVVSAGVVYAAVIGGEMVYAVDANTGAERWRRPVGSGQVRVVTGDLILVDGSELYALELNEI